MPDTGGGPGVYGKDVLFAIARREIETKHKGEKFVGMIGESKICRAILHLELFAEVAYKLYNNDNNIKSIAGIGFIEEAAHALENAPSPGQPAELSERVIRRADSPIGIQTETEYVDMLKRAGEGTPSPEQQREPKQESSLLTTANVATTGDVLSVSPRFEPSLAVRTAVDPTAVLPQLPPLSEITSRQEPRPRLTTWDNRSGDSLSILFERMADENLDQAEAALHAQAKILAEPPEQAVLGDSISSSTGSASSNSFTHGSKYSSNLWCSGSLPDWAG